MSHHEFAAAYKECCVSGRYRGQGQVITSHNIMSLQWRHNGLDGVSNHQAHDCLLNRLFGRRSKKTSKVRITGLCAGNSPGTGEFPTQRASNAENVSIWWRHHVSMAGTSNCTPHYMWDVITCSRPWDLLLAQLGDTPDIFSCFSSKRALSHYGNLCWASAGKMSTAFWL